jgi:DnaD/phage-associated family protein
MTRPFIGFTPDKQRAVRVPEGFFTDLMPHITSMLEMKVTLYLFWRLARGTKEGTAPKMVSLSELDADEDLRSAISRVKGPRPHDEALREGLELCVARGSVLQLRVRDETDAHAPVDITEEYWYILNTRDNRAWIGAVATGEIDVLETPLAQGYTTSATNGHRHPTPDTRHPKIRVIAERPNIFALYEQNIGLLTPLIAEQLQEAERRYPQDWIESAFTEAVSNNKRSWRYIERILERWTLEGRGSGKDRGSDKRSFDPDKYTKGKYAFLFKPE